MKIQQIILREISIPLKFRFSQSNNATSQSHSAILEIQTTNGVIGFGESCPRAYVTGESMESVSQDLQSVAPLLKSKEIQNVMDIKNLLLEMEQARIGPSSRCALELALLDALSKETGRSLYDLLEIANPKTLTYSFIIPMVGVEKIETIFQLFRDFHPSRIKVKIDNQLINTIDRIKAIQNYLGPTIPIRCDINNGWTLEEARQQIPELIKMGINSFEQPLHPDQTEQIAELTKAFGKEAQIMVDESLISYVGAQWLLDHRICNHFNLKISKLGGILRTLDVYYLARKHNIPCQLGAHFGETSLLTSAGVLLANLAEDLTACEGAMGEFLLESDICDPVIHHDLNGELDSGRLFQRVGLSGEMRTEVLENYTTKIEEFPG